MAIREWTKLKDGEEVPLERALAAFDMFVLHERDGDFHDVCSKKQNPEIAAENYRWPLVLTVLRNNAAAKSQILWINRHNKKPSHSQDS